jgi:hypothetical protein
MPASLGVNATSSSDISNTKCREEIMEVSNDSWVWATVIAIMNTFASDHLKYILYPNLKGKFIPVKGRGGL